MNLQAKKVQLHSSSWDRPGKELFADFLRCFSAADVLYVADIYSAGEEAISGITAEGLAAAIDHTDVNYCGDVSVALTDLIDRLVPGDVVVTLGAGSIGKYAQELASLICAGTKRAVA